MDKKYKILLILSIFILICCIILGQKDNLEQTQQTSTKEITKNLEEPKDTYEQKTQQEITEMQYLNESEFKNSCSELIYNDIDKNSVGKYVYKDLYGWENEKDECDFLCAGIEDYNESVGGRTYRVYKIIDCRIDKSFPIEWGDVIRVYGVVDSIYTNYANFLYAPILKIYYIEYIKKVGSEPENKSQEEIKAERIAKNEQIRQEIEYQDSLNTDYNGATKNIDKMDSLALDEYVLHCDKLNYSNLTNGEDFTGRHVAIHVQLFNHKIFKSDNGKQKMVGKWIKPENVCNDVWDCKLYSERAEGYIMPFSHIETLYFLNTENIEPDKLKNENNLIIYGKIIRFDLNNYGNMEVLVRYYELE